MKWKYDRGSLAILVQVDPFIPLNYLILWLFISSISIFILFLHELVLKCNSRLFSSLPHPSKKAPFRPLMHRQLCGMTLDFCQCYVATCWKILFLSLSLDKRLLIKISELSDDRGRRERQTRIRQVRASDFELPKNDSMASGSGAGKVEPEKNKITLSPQN